MATEGQTLEQQLEELLDQEKFSPPDGFKEQAVVSDAAIYEQAEDYEAFWAERAEALHWDTKWDQVLDWSNPPFAKWFVGGKLNVAYNCVDRHVEAGNGDRVAYHWRGEEGEELDVTYADLHRDVQKFANALKDLGVSKGDVVAIYLPMIPEVAVAMLACARIGAIHNVVFGGFSAESVRERIEFSEAKIADHGRRRPPQGQDRADQGDRRRGHRRPRGHDRRRRARRQRRADEGRARPLVRASCSRPPTPSARPSRWTPRTRSTSSTRPARRPSRRASCTPPAATSPASPTPTRRVFDLKPEEDIYWCAADVGWVTGHSYIIYGPLANGTTSVMYEGAPDYPGQGHLVGDRRALQGDDHVLRADRDPRVHEVGRRAPRGARPVSVCACSARSASRSTRRPGSGTGRSIGGGRCPIVDTWWQTETGAIMITTLPALLDAKPGSAGKPLPGIEAAVVDEEGNDAGTEQGYLILKRPWPSMLRTLYKEDDRFIETYWDKFGKDDLPRRRRRAPRRGRLLLDHRAHRRRRERLRPPAVAPPRSSPRSSRTPRSPRPP